VLKSVDGKLYYKISKTEIKLFPALDERKIIMNEAHHNATNHGWRDAMLYEIQKTYYWPKMYESIQNYIKECIRCIKNDQKTNGGFEHIEIKTF